MIGDITARMATYGIIQYTVDEHRHVLILRICFVYRNHRGTEYRVDGKVLKP